MRTALPLLLVISLAIATLAGSLLSAIAPFGPAIESVEDALSTHDPRAEWIAFEWSPRFGWTLEGFCQRSPRAIDAAREPTHCRSMVIAEARIGWPFRSHAFLAASLCNKAPIIVADSAIVRGDRAIATEIVIPGFLGNTAVVLAVLMLGVAARSRWGAGSGARAAPFVVSANSTPGSRWLRGASIAILAALVVAWIVGATIGLFEARRAATFAARAANAPTGIVVTGTWPPAPPFLTTPPAPAAPPPLVTREPIWRTRPQGEDWAAPRSWSWFREDVNALTDVRGVSGFGGGAVALVAELRTGVPLRSSAIAFSRESFDATSSPEPSAHWVDGYEPLPMRVLLPGLLANAGILLVVFGTAPLLLALRRAHRARRGRCPRCGYDRHSLPPDSPCPECGAPLTGTRTR